MKKRVFLSLLIVLMVILVSCQNDSFLKRLEMPDNVLIIKNVVYFDEVENAKGYIISYSGKQETINEPQYTFEEEGTYNFKIKAISDKYLDSLYTESKTIIVKFLNYPQDIDIINNEIVFNEDDDADSYNIKINDKIYNTNKDLIPYLFPGEYSISIQAISDKYVDSDYSPLKTFIISEESIIVTKNNLTYSLNSTSDIPLYHYVDGSLDSFELYLIVDGTNEIEINNNNLEIIGNQINLKYSYIEPLLNIDETYTFVLNSNLGNHEIILSFNENKDPYNFSKDKIITNFYHDVIINFDSFENEFKGLKANNITEDDYLYENGTLIISNEYIMSIYEENPTRKNLILSYEFYNEELKTTYLGFITIGK